LCRQTALALADAEKISLIAVPNIALCDMVRLRTAAPVGGRPRGVL
jgi:hypothetical protein